MATVRARAAARLTPVKRKRAASRRGQTRRRTASATLRMRGGMECGWFMGLVFNTGSPHEFQSITEVLRRARYASNHTQNRWGARLFDAEGRCYSFLSIQ